MPMITEKYEDHEHDEDSYIHIIFTILRGACHYDVHRTGKHSLPHTITLRPSLCVPSDTWFMY